jgi:2-polyprenyl-3-methyl-5-hydroxy-6-metoxy-1,4-benzoquinol methylase
LSESRGRRELSRDYSAHFFRWSFARRLVCPADDVLEVGCGVETPLAKVLTVGVGGARCKSYVGVDLNPLPPTANKRVTLRGEFDFVRRHAELEKADVIIHLEVIEHMRKGLGVKMLEACHWLLRPEGRMIMSTPAYDGVYHAANHVHEWKADELKRALDRAGFRVETVYGTHMDLRRLRTTAPRFGVDHGEATRIATALSEYYDDDALSCILAPLFPAAARNLLWVCGRS